MTEPHSWRCVTCLLEECTYHPKWENEAMMVEERIAYGTVHRHTAKRGCASHSNATSADKVLMTDEQRKYILSFKDEDPLFMAYVEDYNAAKKELRQQGVSKDANL